MTFATSLENFFEETEADVIKVVTAIKQDAMIFESDLAAGLKWIAAQEPSIVSEFSGALAIATELGVASNPDVAAVVAGAQTAIAALQAITASVNSGQTTTQTLVNGYIAVKSADSAATATTAAVVSSPTATKSTTAATAD